MRTFVVVLAAVTVLLGLLFVVSAFARGLGLTRGAILGLVLIAVGGLRLSIEARRGREP